MYLVHADGMSHTGDLSEGPFVHSRFQPVLYRDKWQVRYSQLMKQQEKMIREMEACVSRREAVTVRGEGQKTADKKHFTKSNFHRKKEELRKKIREAQKVSKTGRAARAPGLWPMCALSLAPAQEFWEDGQERSWTVEPEPAISLSSINQSTQDCDKTILELESTQASLSTAVSQKQEEVCRLQAESDVLDSDSEHLRNEKRWVSSSPYVQHMSQTEPAAFFSGHLFVSSPPWTGHTDVGFSNTFGELSTFWGLMVDLNACCSCTLGKAAFTWRALFLSGKYLVPAFL